MALPRANRFPLRLEREHLTRTGKTVHGKFFTLVSAEPSNTTPVPRLAVLLSKKTARLAVDRNKIKRITTSIIEKLLPSLPLQDYLIIPKKSALLQKLSDLQDDIYSIIAKIK